MPHKYQNTPDWLKNFNPEIHDEQLKNESLSTKPLSPRVPAGNATTLEGVERRKTFLKGQGITLDKIAVPNGFNCETIQGNIENFIGFTQVPVGVIGPLRVNGRYAHGDFYVPMATTEGALIASYHRGATAISQSGGVSAICVADSVIRSPTFVFANMLDGIHFSKWVYTQTEFFEDLVAKRTRFGKLINMKLQHVGPIVYLLLEYTTGDAAGQNMVTVTSEEICRHLAQYSPVPIVHWYLEGNLSGDKKASMLPMVTHRGKKVIAEAILPESVVKTYLKSTPKAMLDYGRVSRIGGVHSGTIGIHGHYANALAAIFLACGQDVACVAEAAVGQTDFYILPCGSLQAVVTLPNLIVGTVGGGTHLPTAKEALTMMACQGKDSAKKLAEIIAGAVLAGELSIIAALSVGHFGSAHANFRHVTK